MLRNFCCAGLIVLAGLLLGACSLLPGDGDTTIPPTVASLDTLPTADFLTRNAPPAGFSTFNAPAADVNLAGRQGWAYTVSGRFEGTFDDDGTSADGDFSASVQANELGEARRVVLEVRGAALLPDAALLTMEAVRFSNDYFLVDVNGTCTHDEAGAAIADLTAGQLIGGVRTATPTGFQDDLQGVHVWQYGFRLEDVVLPTTTLKLEPDSTIALEAALWVAPDLNAVVLYEVTAQVRHARLLSSERYVSGTLYLRYELDVSQFDTLPNISIPHGC